MRIEISARVLKNEFVRKVEEVSGQNVLNCYQCGKCSAGCPIVAVMDLLPNQVIRLVQLGQEEVLDSKTIWFCASCFTCAARCPRGVDLAKVMEALRLMSLRRNLDHIRLSDIPREAYSELPQIALVSNFRKFTA